MCETEPNPVFKVTPEMKHGRYAVKNITSAETITSK